MQKRTMRRQLVALGGRLFEPTDAQREMVIILKLNGTPIERIAMALGISRVEVEYHFARELDLGEDAVLYQAAKNVIELANQRLDLGVALRANQAILQPRTKSWRDPKIDPGQSVGDINELTLQEVEAAIARLERERRAASTAADQAEAADPDEDQPA